MIKVKKRNGVLEDIDISKIRKQTELACKGLNARFEELELDAKISFNNEIETKNIQQILINTAASKIAMDAPDWSFVAARLTLYDLYHNIKLLYNEQGDGDVYKKVNLANYFEHNKLILTDFHTYYTVDEIEELNNCIDGTKDLLFNFISVIITTNRYLLRNNGTITELPQHMLMSIAMYAAAREKSDIRMDLVKTYYEKLSSLKILPATPILSNFRKKNSNTSSCLVTSFGDNIESIFDQYKTIAIGSKGGAGWGIDMSRIRGKGSTIGNTPHAAGGIIPFLKILNDIAIAVDQLGTRKGAVAVTIESWHIDVLDFLELRKPNGDERVRARDLFMSISLSDEFMRRCENPENTWTLFDPYDTPDLTEIHGDKFTKKYLEYEESYRNNPSKFNKNTRVIKMRDILTPLLLSYFEEGQPFIFFKDTVNRLNTHPELGIIRTANLCTEYLNAATEHEVAVCNLGSINFSKMEDEEDYRTSIQALARLLDVLIDLTNYPSKEAYQTQFDRRTIGIGVLGEAEYLATNLIEYGSKEHVDFIHKYYGILDEEVLNTTKKLASEKGSCSIPGIRNAYTRCIAPNSNIGLFAGSTNSHEPVFQKQWVENNQFGDIIITAPKLNTDNFNFYKSSYEIDQKTLIDMTSIRQEYIDMGISHTIFLDPEQTSEIKEILTLVQHAWKKNLKTLYYIRSKAPSERASKDDIVCIGCEN